MSRMSELSIAIAGLCDAAAALKMAADSLTALFSGDVETEVESQPTPVAADPIEKLIPLESVRAVLAEKSRAGYTAEVRDLLKKHGAEKLSAVDPASYAALLADAEVLGDG